MGIGRRLFVISTQKSPSILQAKNKDNIDDDDTQSEDHNYCFCLNVLWIDSLFSDFYPPALFPL